LDGQRLTLVCIDRRGAEGAGSVARGGFIELRNAKQHTRYGTSLCRSRHAVVSIRLFRVKNQSRQRTVRETKTTYEIIYI
jgi:hypothetical protein